MSGFWIPLLVKMAAAASVVVLAAWAAERSGPFWGGLIAALPLVTGPIYVLLAIDTDDAFVAASALASFAAIGASILFATAVTRTGERLGLGGAIAAGLGAWLLFALPVAQADWTAATALVLNVAVFALAFALTRDHARRALPPARPVRRWYDHPARAIMVGLLVGSVVTASTAIGPAATGVASVFPVTFLSVVLILMPRLGATFTAVTLAKSLRAMTGMAGALLAVHLGTLAWGVVAGLVAGLLTSLGASLALVLRERRG